MKISVIIPTYNRPQSLVRALQSLQEQTLSDFEILVVDNAADAKVEQIVMDFNRTARIPAQYVPEPRLGATNARHSGARTARGDLLVFADDDQTSDPGWLAAYARAFAEHPEMAAAGGPVRPVWEVTPPAWVLEFIGQAKMVNILGLIEAHDKFQLDPKGVFFGGNMAIRRDVLFQVGGFNPDYYGDVLLGDGETGLNHKLWKRELLIGYVPEAVGYHHIPSQRMTLKYFRHRMANEGACDVYSWFHDGVPHWVRLIKHASGIVRRNGKCWIAALLFRGRTDKRSIDAQIQAARTMSQLKYVIQLILSKDLRQLVLKKDWLNEPCESASSQA